MYEPENVRNVKWLDYTKNLMDIQKSIWRSSSMFDVIISVDGLRTNAHKLVLSACSDFFSNILQEYPPQISKYYTSDHKNYCLVKVSHT